MHTIRRAIFFVFLPAAFIAAAKTVTKKGNPRMQLKNALTSDGLGASLKRK
ncbi:MAG: hypothetical protein FWD36_09100 [Treponema sp.]|nr:hypothetical protein [Treponema sp.]